MGTRNEENAEFFGFGAAKGGTANGDSSNQRRVQPRRWVTSGGQQALIAPRLFAICKTPKSYA